MKKFTYKFILLSMVSLLSMSAYAQETIHHRFPEVKFMYGGKEYIMPAWDVMFGSGDDESMTHVQAKESYEYNQGQTVISKIVSRFGVTADNDFFTSFGGSSSNIIKIAQVDENDNIVYDEEGNVQYNEFAVNQVTYQQACPNYTFNNTDDAGRKVFIYSPSGLVKDEYTITTTKVYNGVTFKIDEIDAWAYRGQKNTSGTYATLAATKVIIPKEITKIGKGAFSYIASKVVEFADDSEIESLSPAAFMCSNVEEITLPASLREIRGAALGGLPNLKHITFKGTVVPSLETDKFENNKYTCDPFTAISRLSTSNVNANKCIIEVPLHSAKDYMDAYNPSKVFAYASPFTIEAESGLMTYCSELDCTFKKYNTETTSWEPGDIKAFYVYKRDVDVDNGRVLLTEISDGNTDTANKMIPAWEEGNEFGVVLQGEYNQPSKIFYPNGKGGLTEKLTVEDLDNCLHGEVTAAPIHEDNWNDTGNSYFMLSKGQFRRMMKDGTCKPYRAYIKVNDGGYDPSFPVNPQALSISFPGEATGITTHEVQGVQNDVFYTLQGVHVKNPQKGVFIKNGKKYIIK